MIEKLRKSLHTVRLIREAIDNYPDGICFAAPGGRPILSNKKINDICYELTGHTITNADRMWEELENRKMPGNSAAVEMESAEAKEKADGGKKTESAEQILCRLHDGQVWQFQRRELMLETGPVTQYEAADVSELYRYQVQLREKNDQLAGMLERQKVLLRNIVDNNLKKELLHTKMRIHADFGKLLVMTENRLTSAYGQEDDSDIFKAWDNVITDMENASERIDPAAASPQKELLKMADMIGCKVEMSGEEPRERRAVLLLYAAIREALTNAVRHSGADCLQIEIRHLQGSCNATITSNGRKDISSIREGGGLSDLRSRLEQEGGTLRMETGEGVAMHITIPEGEDQWLMY